jgi:hypothetical protein
MSQTRNGNTNRTQDGTPRKPVSIPFSSRLIEGRALAEDVWSIFKYVVPSFSELSTHCALTRCSAAKLPADCINLGQGYMNFAPPKWITAAATEALNTVGANHYSHPKGRPRLRQAVKQFYGPQFNRDLDVESEILITSGANEGKWLLGTFSAHRPLINDLSSMSRTVLCMYGISGSRRRSHCIRALLQPVSAVRYIQRWKARLRSPACPFPRHHKAN